MDPVSIQVWLLAVFLVIAAILAVIIVKALDHFRLNQYTFQHWGTPYTNTVSIVRHISSSSSGAKGPGSPQPLKGIEEA